MRHIKPPAPFARSQQLIGVPEHPCEATFRNGCLICPYEEMEVQAFPEHSGLYLIPLLGEPFELFGKDGCRALQSWEPEVPVAVHRTEQQGIVWEEHAFCLMPEANTVKTGKEVLFTHLRFILRNPGSTPRRAVLSFALCNCFRPPIDSDGDWDKFYWKTFLRRDVIYEILDEQREPAPYPYPLRQAGDCLIAEGKGVLLYSPDPFTYEQGSGGSYADGTHIAHCVRFVRELPAGGTAVIDLTVPYLPLPEEKAALLRETSYDDARARAEALWKARLSEGSELSVPGTALREAWRMQTAATLMLLDWQNKGDPALYGRDLIADWADGYPDQTLGYAHLSNALYEFIWAQESGCWVVGMLDRQGYHELAARYLETFFVLQGHATPGVHDPSILPPPEVGQAFTGTTVHAWLNSTGGVLRAVADHYRLTRDRDWLLAHKDGILSACRWVEAVRQSTKTETFARQHGYGLMPPGQSTDSDFSSTHVQWFYTDIWTLYGLSAIADALIACGVPEGETVKAQAEDYLTCFLHALDAAVLDTENMPERPEDYDFSAYLFMGPLERDRITAWDENGIPLPLKDHIIVRSEAEKRGIRHFLHACTLCAVPLDIPYLCSMAEGNAALGLLCDRIDFDSDKPLYPGARHSGRDVGEAVQDTRKLLGLPPFDNNGLSYNEYFLLPIAMRGDWAAYEEILELTRRYGCDPDTYMMVEQMGINRREQWFQPCPFALSMANYRRMLERAVLFEDDARGCLTLCRLLPQEWVENTVTYERPLALTRAATAYGTLSVTYRADLIRDRVTVTLAAETPARLTVPVEVWFRHPLGLRAAAVTVNGIPCAGDGEHVLLPESAVQSGFVTVIAEFVEPEFHPVG